LHSTSFEAPPPCFGYIESFDKVAGKSAAHRRGCGIVAGGKASNLRSKWPVSQKAHRKGCSRAAGGEPSNYIVARSASYILFNLHKRLSRVEYDRLFSPPM